MNGETSTEMNLKSSKRTLLLSVLMSSTGPLVLGISVFFGKSSTQVADLVRRSAEFAAILVAYLVYRSVNKDEAEICDLERKARLENITNFCIGIAMILSAVLMLLVTAAAAPGEKGNVIPGILIAVQGVAVNGLFWRKYSKLNVEKEDVIIGAQARLYRAKTFVDICVLIALLCVAAMPNAAIADYVDKTGSVIVSLYLGWSGATVLRKKNTAVTA